VRRTSRSPSSTESLPRISVGLTPTPLHRLERLSEHLGGARILTKREDLSGLCAGDNKARKLGFLLADAREKGASVVLTWGGVQSNSCAQTACAAAPLGMRAELFLAGEDPGARSGNLRIAGTLGARLVFAGRRDEGAMAALLEERAEDLRREGEVPFVLGLGASEPLGVAGTAGAIPELIHQARDVTKPTHIVLAAGSMGTMAGLILGTWEHGVDARVDGFSVLWPAEKARQRLERLLKETRERHFPDAAPRDNYSVSDCQLGAGYGVPTEAGGRAATLAAHLEGLLLDATYTAKAMAGLVAGCRAGRYGPNDTVVFWHTGGLGGFLA